MIDVDVEDEVVSVVVGGVVEVVSVVVVVGGVSVDDDTVAVSVDPDEDVPLPLSLTLPNAPATRKPITNSAMTATAVHDFFCGPPFFASGAIVLPLLTPQYEST